MKGNNGITLIALIVTVIIMLILASVGTYVGMDTVKHSRLVKFVSYMQIIQRKVDAINNASEDYSGLGKSLTDSGKKNEIINVLQTANAKGEIQTIYAEENESKYRYFDGIALAEHLEIDNIEDEIVINFETREVVSLNGIEHNKSPNYSGIYYTQYLLPTGQQIVRKTADDTRELSFEIIKNIDGLQAAITITNISITNGALSYKEQSGQEKIITNYTETGKDEGVTISKSGTYIFKLTDNANISNYKEVTANILLGNPPELSEGWTYTEESYDYSLLINDETGLIEIGQISSLSNSSAVAKDSDGVTYYWVPRFAYETANINNIKLIKGTSLIATDNTTIDDDWTIPEEFLNEDETGFLDRTGRWLTNTEISNLQI